MAAENFYIDEFQDYLESKCELNKLVAHNKATVAAPTGQRTFARFESDEHITAIVNGAGVNIVVVADVYGQRTGDADDSRLRYTVQLRFASKKVTGTGNETEAINEAVQRSENIMFQFLSLMEKEFKEGCNALETLEPEKVTWNKIDDQPWLDDYYGWDLNLAFGSFMPESDAADWEETP